MSPEQIRGLPLDSRTDLFSFGVVLYEMATGTHPFRGQSAGVIVDAVLNAETRAFPGDVAPEFQRIARKCLEKERDLRYQHASEVLADLRRLERGAVTPAPSKARSRPVAWAASACVAALIAAGAYFTLASKPKLTAKDTIVLADFANSTDDPVLADTVRQGLEVQLAQSPFLSLVPANTISRTFELMGKPKSSPLTGEVAREVCERTNSTALVEGSISRLNTQYVLGLRAMVADR